MKTQSRPYSLEEHARLRDSAETSSSDPVAKLQFFWCDQALKARGLLAWSEAEQLSHRLLRRCIRPAKGTVVRDRGELYAYEPVIHGGVGVTPAVEEPRWVKIENQ